MTLRYRFTDSAKRDLDHELAYSKKQWDLEHAKAYRRSLLAFIRNIAENSQIYAEKPDLGAGMRCARFKGNYVIYRIDKDGVLITNIPSIYQSRLN